MEPEPRISPEPQPPLAWPFLPWFLPLWFAYLGHAWWVVGREKLASAAAELPAVAAAVTGMLALGAKLGGFAIESGFYWAWWRRRGRRIPFGRLTAWIASLSVADLLAHDLAARAALGGVRWMALLTGPGEPHGASHAGEGLASAFAGAGLLACARIATTAHVQARALGTTLARPLLLTAATWLLTRVVFGWSLDLVSGMSVPR